MQFMQIKAQFEGAGGATMRTEKLSVERFFGPMLRLDSAIHLSTFAEWKSPLPCIAYLPSPDST